MAYLSLSEGHLLNAASMMSAASFRLPCSVAIRSARRTSASACSSSAADRGPRAFLEKRDTLVDDDADGSGLQAHGFHASSAWFNSQALA